MIVFSLLLTHYRILITRQVHDSDEDISDNEVRHLRKQRRERRESKLQELDKLLGDAEERQHRAERAEDRLAVSGVWGVLHGKSATEQMLTPWFILIALLTVLQMLRMNFFIATIRAQYEFMLGSEKLARQINNFFDVALPVSVGRSRFRPDLLTDCRLEESLLHPLSASCLTMRALRQC